MDERYKEEKMDALKKMALARKLSENPKPLDLSNPMDRMVYGQMTADADQKESEIRAAMYKAMDNPSLEKSSDESERKQGELLLKEQKGTPAQQERFKRLLGIVYKQRYGSDLPTK